MFQKTPKEQQLAMFFSSSSLLTGKSKNYYEKEVFWHNLFRKQITMHIDENPFSILFSQSMGVPNKSEIFAANKANDGSGYFTQNQIDACLIRKQIRNTPINH